jgi:glycosyltransferase involved in cell wall biosynthesis
VITRNEEAHIEQCLRAILTAVREIGHAEIVVADSASTDHTVAIAQSLGVRVISLRPEWNLSPSAGRYIGYHHTSGELVMFVDADTVIDRHWFTHAIQAFDQSDVGAVTGFLDDVDEKGNLLPYVGNRSPEVCVINRLRGIGLYRRSALRQVGTFNPYLVTEEEAELALRLRADGWKLLQLPHQMGCHMRGAEMQAEIIRGWRLGRVKGLGKTQRYALRAGNGLRFCLERFLPTIMFVAALVSLLALGSGLKLAGLSGGWMIVAGLAAAWMIAVAIRKRNILGPLAYVLRHSLVTYGVFVGMLTATVRNPDDYPRDAKEEPLARYQVG